MDQLDLFSSLPQPQVPQKKEPKKVALAAESEEQDLTGKNEIVAEELSDDVLVESESAAVFPPSVIVFEDDEPAGVVGELGPEKTPEEEQNIVSENSAETFENTRKPPAKRGRKAHKEMAAEIDLVDIPADEILFKKQYYSISEVAGWFKVNTSLLRFWEIEFDILQPRKNRKGDRLFRPEDVKNLELIYYLLRDRKFTIEGAKDYLKGNKKKADAQFQITQSLQKFKSFLLELKANLQ